MLPVGSRAGGGRPCSPGAGRPVRACHVWFGACGGRGSLIGRPAELTPLPGRSHPASGQTGVQGHGNLPMPAGGCGPPRGGEPGKRPAPGHGRLPTPRWTVAGHDEESGTAAWCHRNVGRRWMVYIFKTKRRIIIDRQKCLLIDSIFIDRL